MTKVTTLKGFNDSATGEYIRRGASIEVTPERHKELARSGLVPPPKGGEAAEPAEKAAETPDNKAITAAAITNKAAPAPKSKAKGGTAAAGPATEKEAGK